MPLECRDVGHLVAHHLCEERALRCKDSWSDADHTAFGLASAERSPQSRSYRNVHSAAESWKRPELFEIDDELKSRCPKQSVRICNRGVVMGIRSHAYSARRSVLEGLSSRIVQVTRYR